MEKHKKHIEWDCKSYLTSFCVNTPQFEHACWCQVAKRGETFVDQQNGYDSRYTFSAKEKDDETSYSYFGARYFSDADKRSFVSNDSDLSMWLSVDPMADSRSWISPYNYCQNNPIMRVDPNGMWDDNYTIFADGSMSKEETSDNFNTYTVYNSNGEKVFYNKCPVVKNDNEEDMVSAADGTTGSNSLYSWTDITSGNSYLEEDTYAGFLGAAQNFYENVEQNVEKVNAWQFMSLNRVHSESPDRHSNIDVFFYNTSGQTALQSNPLIGFDRLVLTTDQNISLPINLQLLASFKKFGLGSDAVFSSTNHISYDNFFAGTTGWPKHDNHFHFQGFNGAIMTQLKTVSIISPWLVPFWAR